jgi:DNA-binding transcriptional LysR family regulator
MELRQLEFVVALAETQSFTRAAERVGVTQSAMSHQISQLEAELGTRLFERTTRAVRITEAGRLFLPTARRVLRELERAGEELASLDGVRTGRLRVGATQTATQRLDLFRVVGQFHREHPGVALSNTTGPGSELLDLVSSYELDVAFCAQSSEPCPAGLVFAPLVEREPLIAVVPETHSLSGRKVASLLELAHGPFIEFRRGTELRRRVDNVFRTAGIDREVALEAGQIREMIGLAVAGLGIAVVPECFVAPTPAIGLGNATVLRLIRDEIDLVIGAYRVEDGRSPAANAFVDLVERALTAASVAGRTRATAGSTRERSA